MKNKNRPQFLLMLPVLTVPFLVLAGWILRGSDSGEKDVKSAKGLNTQLPAAVNGKDSVRDKLSFYQAARADSTARALQQRNESKDSGKQGTSSKVIVSMPAQQIVYKPVKRYTESNPAEYRYQEELPKPIESVVAADPELQEINSMLEKLKDLQHPSPSSPIPQETKTTATVYPAEAADENYFGKKRAATRALFLGEPVKQVNGISAVLPVRQILQSGSVVKLSLLSPISFGATKIPAGTYVFGLAIMSGERLIIEISSIRLGEEILPVSLSVYDMDGMEGLYVPGTLEQSVLKESADNSVQSASSGVYGLSLGSKIAGAGLDAAKSLFGKKVKVIRVTVEAGYRVLLRDKKQNL